MPWHEIAAARGVAAHPLMSWHDLVAFADGRDQIIDPLPQPAELSGPECGRLEDGWLTAIAAHLARFTSTPDSGVAGVWDGWGDLYASSYGRSWQVVGGSSPNPVPGLPDEVRDGPRLQLPWRDHVLFDAGASEFTAGWPYRAPWAHGSHPQSPSVLWPDDRAWVLVCDVDWTSTIVGAPVELMAPLLRDPALDGCLVPPGTPAAVLG